MMTDVFKDRRRLLQRYRETGDPRYIKAYECLKPTILELLRCEKPGRRGTTVARNIRPRLFRMHKRIAAGSTVLAAARAEVAEHGHGSPASYTSAVDFLRSQYRKNRKAIAAEIAVAERMLESQRQLLRMAQPPVHLADIERMVESQRRLFAEAEASARQTMELARVTQQPLPPRWAYTDPLRWIGGLGQQLLGWRNTWPKSIEKRSNDKGASM